MFRNISRKIARSHGEGKSFIGRDETMFFAFTRNNGVTGHIHKEDRFEGRVGANGSLCQPGLRWQTFC